MKAISLWQPWASAIIVGSKLIETRHWTTGIRGTIAIHAAKRLVIEEMKYIEDCSYWRGALWTLPGVREGKPFREILPFGAILGTATLADVLPVSRFAPEKLDEPRLPQDGPTEHSELYHLGWSERMMGNYERGRYGWIFSDIKMLKEPLAFRGAQGFFDVPDDLLPAEAFING